MNDKLVDTNDREKKSLIESYERINVMNDVFAVTKCSVFMQYSLEPILYLT